MQRYPSHHTVRSTSFFRLIHLLPRLLDQFMINNSAGAGRLAPTAIQAQIQMSSHRLGCLNLPIRQRTQKLDSTPWRIRLVPGLCISRTDWQAQSAMHAPPRHIIDTRINRQSRIFALGLSHVSIVGFSFPSIKSLMTNDRELMTTSPLDIHQFLP